VEDAELGFPQNERMPVSWLEDPFSRLVCEYYPSGAFRARLLRLEKNLAVTRRRPAWSLLQQGGSRHQDPLGSSQLLPFHSKARRQLGSCIMTCRAPGPLISV